MACFIVPAAEAVVTTVVTRVVKSKEGNAENGGKLHFSDKMKWLNGMLWGGSGMLAFEHVWHGEVVPFFPFLTNAVNAADRVEMLQEMSTSGVGMAVLVTAVWAVMVAVSVKLEKTEPANTQTAVKGV